MKIPESDFQILRLTKQFYEAYPAEEYREILVKKQRAYNCLLFETHYEYFICIPFRTEITHNNSAAIIDGDEYIETVKNIGRIKREALAFVEDYVAHCIRMRPLDKEEFHRRYRFSPLKYFHKELGI